MFDRSFEHEPLPLMIRDPSGNGSEKRLPEAFVEHFRIVGPGESKEDYEPEDFHGSLDVDSTESVSSGLADTAVKNRPSVAIEDLETVEGRLRFVNQVYAYYRWRRFREQANEISDLIEFHSHQKLILLAHDPSKKSELGHMLANPPEDQEFEVFLDQYEMLFLGAFRNVPSRERHFNVLEHLYGYLSEMLPSDQREALLETIRAFHRGEEPLSEPIKILKNHFDGRSIDWINEQNYLNATCHEWELKKGLREEYEG